MSNNDLGLGAREKSSNENQQNINHGNTVSKTCKIASVIMMFLVFLGGFGFINSAFTITLSVWIGGFIVCLFLYAIGEIINILEKINSKLK